MKRIQLLITFLVSALLLSNSVNVKASANEKSAVLKIKSNILPLANITKIVNENRLGRF
ncbi:MAG: hypothetical protein NT104_01740 [Bacteroidetes bacterium]|nr:hypothetical protein [Bacteroidota bacterium]